MLPTLVVPRQVSKPGPHAPGLLGRRPLIGVVMVLLGGLLFGAMAINLQTHGPLLSIDTQIANDLHSIALHSSAALRGVVDLSASTWANMLIMAIGLILVLYSLAKRFWPELSIGDHRIKQARARSGWCLRRCSIAPDSL